MTDAEATTEQTNEAAVDAVPDVDPETTEAQDADNANANDAVPDVDTENTEAQVNDDNQAPEQDAPNNEQPESELTDEAAATADENKQETAEVDVKPAEEKVEVATSDEAPAGPPEDQATNEPAADEPTTEPKKETSNENKNEDENKNEQNQAETAEANAAPETEPESNQPEQKQAEQPAQPEQPKQSEVKQPGPEPEPEPKQAEAEPKQAEAEPAEPVEPVEPAKPAEPTKQAEPTEPAQESQPATNESKADDAQADANAEAEKTDDANEEKKEEVKEEPKEPEVKPVVKTKVHSGSMEKKSRWLGKWRPREVIFYSLDNGKFMIETFEPSEKKTEERKPTEELELFADEVEQQVQKMSWLEAKCERGFVIAMWELDITKKVRKKEFLFRTENKDDRDRWFDVLMSIKPKTEDQEKEKEKEKEEQVSLAVLTETLQVLTTALTNVQRLTKNSNNDDGVSLDLNAAVEQLNGKDVSKYLLIGIQKKLVAIANDQQQLFGKTDVKEEEANEQK